MQLSKKDPIIKLLYVTPEKVCTGPGSRAPNDRGICWIQPHNPSASTLGVGALGFGVLPLSVILCWVTSAVHGLSS